MGIIEKLQNTQNGIFFVLQWFVFSKIIKIGKNNQIQGKLSANRKISQKINFFGLAGVLVGFSKKRAKKAKFILEKCIKSGLSKSIAHDFDRI